MIVTELCIISASEYGSTVEYKIYPNENWEWSDMNSKKYPRPSGRGYFFEFMSDHSKFE